MVLLAHVLAQVARTAGDHAARSWLQTARTLLIAVAVLPAVVLGGGLDSLDDALDVVGSLALLLLVVLLFRYSDRPWRRRSRSRSRRSIMPDRGVAELSPRLPKFGDSIPGGGTYRPGASPSGSTGDACPNTPW